MYDDINKALTVKAHNAAVFTLAALCLLVPASAADLAVRLDDSFPAATRQDLSVVAAEVAGTVSSIFGKSVPPLLLPVICSVGSPPPVTYLDNWSKPTRIHIRVTVGDRGYAQFAYQLGHELGHVMLGIYRSNSTVETIATAVSLEVLERLARKWQSHAPYPEWRSYAAVFGSYREEQETNALRRTGLKNLWRKSDVLKSRLRELNATIDTSKAGLMTDAGRDLQVVGAMILRSDFIVMWSTFVGIDGCTSPPPVKEPRFMYSALAPGCITKRAPTLAWLVASRK